MAPRAKINDGFCDIITMKSSQGKYNLVKLLLNQDSGDYFNANGNLRAGSGVEYIKTKCFRLIPKNNLNDSDNLDISNLMHRFYSIDGERYPLEPIQVKTLRKSFRVFCFDTKK